MYLGFLLSIIRFFNRQVLELSYESSLLFVSETHLGGRFVLKCFIKMYSQKKTNKQTQGTEEWDCDEKEVIHFLTHPSTQQQRSNFCHHLIECTGSTCYFSSENSQQLTSHSRFPQITGRVVFNGFFLISSVPKARNSMRIMHK